MGPKCPIATQKVPHSSRSAFTLWCVVVLLVTKQAHTHTHTHPVRVTHPIRETICSTMCLLKVMITNSFCMTKKHTEEEHVSRWSVRSAIAGKAVKHSLTGNPLIPPFSHKHSHYSVSPIMCVTQPKRFGVKAETKGKKSEPATHVSVSPRLPLEQPVCNVHTDRDMENQMCHGSRGACIRLLSRSCLVTSTEATNRRLPVIPALVLVGGACRQ